MKSFCISLIVFVLYMMVSCRTEYVPVESIRYDSIFIAKLQKDSIFIHDSIYTKEKGDTVFQNKIKYIYRYVGKTDTLYIERRDSILVPYPVEKKLTKYQQAKLRIADIFITIGFIYTLYRLVGWIVKRTRKE